MFNNAARYSILYVHTYIEFYLSTGVPSRSAYDLLSPSVTSLTLGSGESSWGWCQLCTSCTYVQALDRVKQLKPERVVYVTWLYKRVHGTHDQAQRRHSTIRPPCWRFARVSPKLESPQNDPQLLDLMREASNDASKLVSYMTCMCK